MKTSALFPALVLAAAAGGIGLAARELVAQDSPSPDKSEKKEFRYENKGDGKPRFFYNGKEVNPDDSNFEDLKRMFGDRSGAQDDNPFGGRGLPFGFGQQDGDDQSDPFRMMDEMLERMRGQMRERPGGSDSPLPRMRFGMQNQGRDAGEASRYSKNHRAALAEWRTVVAPARAATVRVLGKDGNQLSLATIVTADGFAVTKTSELGKDREPKLECEFNDGRIVTAKVVDRLAAYDLALLKLDAKDLAPVTFRSADLLPGTMVAVSGIDEDPMAVGVVSSQSRSFDDRSKGFMGVLLSQTSSGIEGVGIDQVNDDGAASRAGMKKGDIVLAVNGEPVKYAAQLKQIVASLKPDEQVKFTISRDGEKMDLTLSLGRRSDANIPDLRRMDPTAQMGSDLSENASGYPNAVQCDVAVNADEIGGPAVDVDGNVVGITIARAERTSTLLIPASIVSQLTSGLTNGKFQLARDKDTLKNDLRDHESKVKELQEQLEKAEAERKAATEELEKLGK